nr:MAG TPA: hypothetical protein [Caudoviricetes sp.]
MEIQKKVIGKLKSPGNTGEKSNYRGKFGSSAN